MSSRNAKKKASFRKRLVANAKRAAREEEAERRYERKQRGRKP